MAITIGTREIERYIKTLEHIRNNADEITKKAVYNIAGRVLADAVDNTPVGVYTNLVDFTTRDGERVVFFTAKKRHGGNLKQKWKLGRMKKTGKLFQVEITNPEKYAEFVEYGHRIVNKEGITIGWKEGVFMLYIAETKVDAEKENIIKQIIEKELKVLEI